MICAVVQLIEVLLVGSVDYVRREQRDGQTALARLGTHRREQRYELQLIEVGDLHDRAGILALCSTPGR